jgi:superfamily I DNA/RNA helicase
VLVLAGPGAGKTFCLIERIRYLVTAPAVAPERICVLTFTNKAAEEVAGRLRRDLGSAADAVTKGTLHSLCVRILRGHGHRLGLAGGFGIADEEYQKEVLGKFRVPSKWRSGLLNRFGLHRLGRQPLHPDDERAFAKYRAYLAKRGMVDFDDLTHYAAELLDRWPEVATAVAGQWDHVLVDEFQDLNPVQYRIARTLAIGHRNLFVVGDDEQSIFSWTGADPRLITTFLNDFGVTHRVVLGDNHRTAKSIFALARALIAGNQPILDVKEVRATRETAHPVESLSFEDDAAERAWLLDDLARDQRESGLSWGEYAILYRKHQVGDALEGVLMRAGIPCRLAHGRAVSDDPVVRYLIAALKVIAFAGDPIVNESFIRLVLPSAVSDAIRRQAEAERIGFMPMARRRARELPYADETGKKLRRALYAMQNLAALGHRHRELAGLVEEILSQRVGPYRTVLEERVDELADPAAIPEVVRLAAALGRARECHGRVLLPSLGGAEIGLAGMLAAGGVRLVDYLGVGGPPGADDLVLDAGAAAGRQGLALTTFKALQLLTALGQDNFRDFVVVDLETTDRDPATAEIVEVGAVRVRNWEVTEEFHRLVKPRVPIAEQAARTHGYTEADLHQAEPFERVWPDFKAFIGSDVLVAHNGYEFDFPILRRMTGGAQFVTYDTLPLARSLRVGSAKLTLLATRFGIDPGDPHKALSDVRTLAKVFRKLEEEKLIRARRVALSGALDYLGLTLALADPETLDEEGRMLREVSAGYALGRYSNCLEFYRAERERVGPSAKSVEEVIDRLGGTERMARVRAGRRPDQRYPQAMARVRRLLGDLESVGLAEQVEEFLQRVALSRSDGIEADPARVNLLTLHSTKGLEFSRVYLAGVEDSELPGSPSGRGTTIDDLEEARRLLYVGMTRAKDRLVMTRVAVRAGRPTGGHRFLDEMGLVPTAPLPSLSR